MGLVAMVLGGCLELPGDEPVLSEDSSEILLANKLASNKLAANKLATNKLAANKLAASSLEAKQLVSTADGREVMSFVVGCAIPSGQSVTLQDTAGVQYTFPGWLGLAPGWATRTPTVSERRWVTACLLARTNVYGVAVNISMRHDTNGTLFASAAEQAQYTATEGTFYGDLFGPTPLLYACATRSWTAYQANAFRACALSASGSTTDCGFTYTGVCSSPVTCSDTTAPFSSCKSGSVAYAETITIFLTPTQQQGQLQ